jgi:hypothetical protein
MAKLSANGYSLGKLSYLKFDKNYMSNGHILINRGDGWKQYKKVKEGFDPKDVFTQAHKAYCEKLDACPSLKDFYKLLFDETSLKNRAMVVTAFEMLGNDIDGLWASLDDYDMRIELETLQEMADCYDMGMKELRAYKEKLAGKIN